MMWLYIAFLLIVSPVNASEREGFWWYKQAREFYSEGNLDRALALLKAIPRRFPQDQELLLKASLLTARIYYEKRQYNKAIKILKPLVQKVSFPSDALLILAECYQAKGLYNETLAYLNLLRKRPLPQETLCHINVMESRLYLAKKLRTKAKSLCEEVLNSTCSLREKSQAINLLIEAGEPIQNFLPFVEKHPQVRYYVPQILKSIALYHLKKGELSQAEREIFEYLNYSGREKEGPCLLYDLGQAYFKAKRYREARRIYELILTSWPYSSQATFAKFWLYYMRYLFEEKIGHKTAYTRRLLLAICRRLKKEFPKESITERAHALEIKLLYEDRKPERALESSWEFLKRYPNSLYLPKVYEVLCQASSLVDQKFLAQKAYIEFISYYLAHKNDYNKAKCGLHFYWLAQAYQRLNLTEEALLSLIKAKEFSVPKVWETNLLMNLVDLLLEEGEEQNKKLASNLLQEVASRYPDVVKSPYYQFLLGWLAFENNDWAKASISLKSAFQGTSDEELRRRAKELYLETLLREGNLEKAFLLAKKDKKPPLLLLKRIAVHSIISDHLTLAQEVTHFLVKMIPDDDEAWWLRALVYERLGEAKKAQKIWAKLSKKDSIYANLASDIVRASSLIEKARSEIY